MRFPIGSPRDAEMHEEAQTNYGLGGNPHQMDESDAQLLKKMEEMRNIYVTKDSGKRQEFTSGMVRDVTEGKIDYTLVLDGPMFERWAALLARGAAKYDKRNWMKASGQAELDRFKESAFRHFRQWLRGDEDEDHAAATYFNICGYEYVKEKLNGKSKT